MKWVVCYRNGNRRPSTIAILTTNAGTRAEAVSRAAALDKRPVQWVRRGWFWRRWMYWALCAGAKP